MIDFLSVRDYQSLAKVDLDIKPLTVIIGPSSSGKSALVRALKTLTANQRGHAFVSSWGTAASIEVGLTHRPVGSGIAEGQRVDTEPVGSVILSRGEKQADNFYEIRPPAGPNEDAPPTRFTKLGGEVPEEISQFLGIHARDPLRGTALHFASQFDKPYLLDESPAEVARSFAALTNVQVIFAAAREANRQRLSTTATLKIRQSDLQAVDARADEFNVLAAQRSAQIRAEDALQRAQDLTARIKNLESLITALEVATTKIEHYAPLLAVPLPHAALEQAEELFHRRNALGRVLREIVTHQATLNRVAPSLSGTVPTMDRIDAAHTAMESFRGVLVRLRGSKAAVEAARGLLDGAESALSLAMTDHQSLLVAAGVCPTCSQPTAALAEPYTQGHTSHA